MPSDARGLVDVAALRAVLDRDVAGIMLTNPNTLGLFEEEIDEIAAAVHEVGGLLYYDGANLNAILGVVRPGDMGFDVVHLNLHKTFATPHGGGGPGAGPVAVSERLAAVPAGAAPEARRRRRVEWGTPPRSIGRLHSWHGNALVLARAHAYLRLHGGRRAPRVAERAVLNANWLRERLSATTRSRSTARACTRWCSTADRAQAEHRRAGPRRRRSGSWRRASTRRPCTSRSSSTRP